MKEIKTILFTFSLSAILLLTFSFNQFSLIFICFSFLFFSTFLFEKKNLNIYILSCSVNIIYFVLYTFITSYETNSLFLSGGDDEFFYSSSIEILNNNFDPNTNLSTGHYLSSVGSWGYLYFNSLILKFLKFFPFYEPDILSFRLIKSLLSALVPVFVYKIFKDSVFRLSDKGLLLLILFPALIFFNYSLVRESYVALLFGMFIYINIYYKNSIIKYFLLTIIFLIAFSFREISGVFMIIFFISYHFKFKKNQILWSSFFIIFVSYFAFYIASLSEIGAKFIEVQKIYAELSQSNNSASLGLTVLNSQNPLMIPIKLIYILISPIPPVFIYNPSLSNFIKLVGNFSWYFVCLGTAIYYIKNKNISDKISYPLLLTLVFSLVVIVNTSMDPRHIAYLYPFFLPIGIYGIKMLHYSKRILLYFSLFFLLVILYIFLKI